MMSNFVRTQLLTLFILPSNDLLFAQFPSFPDHNAVWVETVHEGPDLIEIYAYHIKQAQNDTMINGASYTTLWAGLENQGGGFAGGIKEETDGKVYYYHPNSDSTYLLYDFDPLLGDSMEVWVGNILYSGPLTQMMYVGSIDTLYNNNGTMYKSIGILSQSALEGAQGITQWWIQGVGGTGGLFTTIGSLSLSQATGHACMSHNDTLWPDGVPGSCASIMSIPSRTSPEFDIWPNPTAGLFTVRMPLERAKVQEFLLFDALGRQIPINVEKGRASVEVAIASPGRSGIYLLRSFHADGTSSFSRLILQP